jgi:hypothetical protein
MIPPTRRDGRARGAARGAEAERPPRDAVRACSCPDRAVSVCSGRRRATCSSAKRDPPARRRTRRSAPSASDGPGQTTVCAAGEREVQDVIAAVREPNAYEITRRGRRDLSPAGRRPTCGADDRTRRRGSSRHRGCSLGRVVDATARGLSERPCGPRRRPRPTRSSSATGPRT